VSSIIIVIPIIGIIPIQDINHGDTDTLKLKDGMVPDIDIDIIVADKIF